MKKITIGLNDKVLEVTEKAFNVVYKSQGYKEIGEKEESTVGELLEDLTVKELKELAKDKEIENYSTMKKEELIEAIEGE